MEQLLIQFGKLMENFSYTLLFGLFGSIFTYLFGINFELGFILFMMVVLDTVTGIIKAKKLGQKISSGKGFGSTARFALYNIAIMSIKVSGTAGVVAYHLPEDIVCGAATGAALWFIALELKSIKENFEEMGFVVPKGIFKNIIDILTKKQK